MNKKEKSIQILMEELQQSLQVLSKENLPIEEALSEYAKAATLIESCYKNLNIAQLKVQEIDEHLAALEERDGI